MDGIENRFFVSRTRGWVHLPPPEAVPYPCFTLVSLFPTLVLRYVPYLGFGEGGKIRDAPPEAVPYLYFTCFPCSVPWFCNLFPTLVLARVGKLGMLESRRPPQDYQSRLSPSACCLKSQFLTFFECFSPSLTPGRSSQDFNPQCCSTPRYSPKLILPTFFLILIFWMFSEAFFGNHPAISTQTVAPHLVFAVFF